MSNSSDKRVLIREQHAMPTTKAGITTLVRELLPCQKLIIEQGHPIRVWRLVDEDPMQEVNLDLDGMLRNSEILEYVNPNEEKTAADVLFHMMQILRNEKSYPVCWVTGPTSETLKRWLQFAELGLPGELTELFGVPIKNEAQLPEETLILAGAEFVEGDIRDIKVAVKTAMEIREVKEKKNAEVVGGDVDRSGPHPGGDGPPNGEVESYPGGDGKEVWSPSRFLRQRFNGVGPLR